MQKTKISLGKKTKHNCSIYFIEIKFLKYNIFKKAVPAFIKILSEKLYFKHYRISLAVEVEIS
jgi:hypothetical protein